MRDVASVCSELPVLSVYAYRMIAHSFAQLRRIATFLWSGVALVLALSLAFAAIVAGALAAGGLRWLSFGRVLASPDLS